jgi:hypothetical protein
LVVWVWYYWAYWNEEKIKIIFIPSLTIKSSGQFKASRFLRSKKARPFKLRADLGVMFFKVMDNYQISKKLWRLIEWIVDLKMNF